MASSIYNVNSLSRVVPNAQGMRIGIVVSEWNDNITSELAEGAISTLKKFGVADDDIIIRSVPGSFELVFGCAQMIKSGWVDGVIAIGCIIRGDTPHFEYIST